MKPLKLEFEGINSFSEHTIIDFEFLTKNGIFGIFGDTGSGKSTILDCINFALYGNVERSKEKTDIINYNSDKAFVKFVFNILNEGKRKVYTVERTIKRDKSGTHKAVLYENDGEKELCIADKALQVERKVVEILGVEAEDFRKCIALPQGEFAQFVKSAPRERLALIERLFSLSKYGDTLREKLNSRQVEAESVYQNVAGRMLAYAEISEETIKSVKAAISEKEKKLRAAESELKQITSCCEELKLLVEKRRELDNTIKKLETLSEKKAETDELKSLLSRLPSCREIAETEEALGEKIKIAVSIGGDIKRLEAEIAGKDEEIKKLENDVKDYDFDNRIAGCVSLSAKYSLNAGKADKLKELLAGLDKKRAEYKEKGEELTNLSDKFICLQNAHSVAVKKLETCAVTDISQIVNEEFKSALLRREYVDNLDYFIEFKDGVEIYRDDTPLYNYVRAEVGNKIKEYKQRVEYVADVEVGDIEKQLEKYRAAEKEREKLQKAVNDCNAELQKADGEIKLKQKELEIAKKEGKDIRARADEIERELESAFGKSDCDFSAIIDENEKRLSNLKKQKEEFSVKLIDINNSRNNLIVSLERLKALSVSADAEVIRLKTKLGNLLQTGGFKSVDECLMLSEKFKNIKDAEKTITDYEMQFSALSVRKSELESVDKIADASYEAYVTAKNERERLSECVSDAKSAIAVLNADLENLEVKLSEKNILSKDFDKAVKERELIAKLKEVTKGNKFLEYIANEYLCDISSLASSTLIRLCDGRYFLTYKDNNFYVGDNFNCGNLRGVNTLSGGETFLVSLSLALALSQTICAKSMKSIEFFFLDEGFGTLDNSLVDTVMNALEKLKSSAFVIGVISHVEELKYRIDSKITVNKATETRGSTVSVSC